MPLTSLLRAFAALLALAAIAPARAAPEPRVGFQRVVLPGNIEAGFWYPTRAPAVAQPLGLFSQAVAADAPVAGRRLPLVVISHGTGGSFAGHFDTALALARAGFVVASLTHPGDNWRDQSAVTRIAGRPAALSALISYALTAWRGHAAIDPRRIGAFGFSAGGFTVLAAAGGVPDLSRMWAHCAAHPAFFDCSLLAAHGGANALAGTAPQWRADRRITAVVAAAPALGFAFGRAGLAGLRVPVQLWAAGDDRVLPAPYYVEPVRDNLPRPPEFHVEPRAGHFDFLAPCSPAMAAALPEICASAPGYDRAAFHARFNAAVVAFFRAQLERP